MVLDLRNVIQKVFVAEGFADSPEAAQAAAEKALVDLGYKLP